MKAFLKATRLSLLLVVLCSATKAQREFIDSIHNMLIDLNEQIQYAPINRLLQQTIPYCTGNTINDSLAAGLKRLFSDDYLFRQGIIQPVSNHLYGKYTLFIQRITAYLAETGNATDHQENMMRMAFVKIRLTNKNCCDEAKDILVLLQFQQPILHAKWLRNLAEMYSKESKFDSSYIFFRRSLLENPDNTLEENIFYEETLHAFAEFCRSNNKSDTALLLLQQLLSSVEKMHNENTADYAYWLIRIADSYTYMAKYDLALRLDFKAREITLNTLGELTNQYALCLAEIGEIYYRTGQYEKALPYSQQALDIKRNIFGNDYFDNVLNLHDLATLYTRMGLYNEAVPLLNESLAISKKYYGEGVVYALDLHSLAEVYEYLGEYDKALPLYRKALLLQGANAETGFYYPRILHSIASLFTKLGQYDKAIDLFKQTLQLKKEVFGELNPEYTKTLNSYAEVCLLKGDYKNALSLQQRSLDINKEIFGETHPDIATGLYNLATLYYDQNRLQKAEGYCNKALQLQTKILGQSHPDIATSYDMLGNINQRLGLSEAAHKYYQKAFEIRKKIMNTIHPDYVQSLYNLAVMYIKEGKITKATQLLIQADSASLLHIEESHGSLSEEEKLIYLHNREKQFQYLPSLLYLHKTNSPDIVNRVYSDAIVLKSMVLFQQQQVYNSIRKSGDSIAMKLYNHWRFNKAFLGQQILLPPEKRFSDFDSLQDVTTQLDEQLSHVSLAFRNNALYNEAGIKAIVQHLAKDEAALEFIRFRLYDNNWTDSIIYAAIVLLPGKKNAIFIPLFEENQLKKLMQFSNNSGEAAINYLYPSANRETDVSNRLYKLVWQPFRLLFNNIKTVYYSPSGLLYRISFAALHSGNNKLLIEKYNLRQLLCTRSIAWSVEEKINFKTASLWGGIDYDITFSSPANSPAEYNTTDSFSLIPSYELNTSNKDHLPAAWQPLPGTKTEAEKIFLLLKEKNIVSELESGIAASEEEFKKMDGASPSLIHIATHGFFLPPTAIIKTNEDFLYETNSFTVQQNPMFRSGLLLAGANTIWTSNTSNKSAEDGVLTAYEISQLDLSNTQLVTLSACETALGDIGEDNEGVYGLQRAFKMAGAKQILMSLWKVPDEQTTQLMVLFYNSILQGNDENTALRKAQLIMKEKYSPYYWAGFVLSE
jgi:CHAT domain-containing protein/Tfp pilus assembly protein PilF